MIIRELAVGPLMANCFIVGCKDTKKAVVIDPGDEADKILMALAKDKLTVSYILNTHGHFDHVGANKKLKEATSAKLAIHEKDATMLKLLSGNAAVFGLSAENSPDPDFFLTDGLIIEFGKLSMKVIHTPGHSPGGVSFYCGNVLFAGDTLFSGSIGRTDFPEGDHDTLISGIREKLFVLPDDTVVYTGHGPKTAIGNEKRYNPFCRIA